MARAAARRSALVCHRLLRQRVHLVIACMASDVVCTEVVTATTRARASPGPGSYSPRLSIGSKAVDFGASFNSSQFLASASARLGSSARDGFQASQTLGSAATARSATPAFLSSTARSHKWSQSDNAVVVRDDTTHDTAHDTHTHVDNLRADQIVELPSA